MLVSRKKLKCETEQCQSEVIVALVCYGERSTNKIAAVLNRLNVKYGVLEPYEVPVFVPTHIILSGGPAHVYNENHYKLANWIIQSQAPVLAICYGMQLVAQTFGGRVIRMRELEKGPVAVTEILNGRQITKNRWMNRWDQVICVPDEFTITGVTDKNHIASFTDYDKWWCVQYHPESLNDGDINVFINFFNGIWRTQIS